MDDNKLGEIKKETEEGKLSKMDSKKINELVEKLKRKYREKGITFEKAEGKVGKLRSLVVEKYAKREITIEDMAYSPKTEERTLAKIYLVFPKLFKALENFFKKLPFYKDVPYYLYCANIKLTPKQYFSISAVVLFLFVVFSFVLSGFLLALGVVDASFLFLIPFLSFFLGLVGVYYFPLLIAKKRAGEIERHLPFALRHMAAELRSGVSIYKVIQLIAAADYGDLSDEFSRILIEIDEGLDLLDALKNSAERVLNNSYRSAVYAMIRAIKTGGALSESLERIAENVSFTVLMKIREYGEKLNFFGVIYLFISIVFPVMVGILGVIRNSPIGENLLSSLSSLPLSVGFLGAFYVVLMPLMLLFLVFYVLVTQPKM